MAPKKEIPVTTKFNPKQYQDKARIYRPVVGAPRVLRLWVWDADRLEYTPPEQGKCYEARRYEMRDGRRVRVKSYFDSLEAARAWQTGRDETPTHAPHQADTGKRFSEIVEEWKKRAYSTLAVSTCVAYDKMLRLHFRGLMGLGIYEITPKAVDQWLDELKAPGSHAMRSSRRRTFSHELELLSSILKYFVNYNDDPKFQYPIKVRHREAVVARRGGTHRPKDLSEADFFRFREELLKLRFGTTFAAMATVQYFQALRISEAAGLHWEDLELDSKNPEQSRLKVVRYVCWPRKRGLPSFVQDGFKNAEANDGIKEQPLFPESYESLMRLGPKDKKGLIFDDRGRHFEYRQIQYAYDTAFQRAGLPYRGTHVMRHGGCRRVYNAVPDPAVAQQLLGNSSLQTTLVYAKRHKGALTAVAREEWKEKSETGRNWSQDQVTEAKTESFQEGRSKMAGELGFEPR